MKNAPKTDRYIPKNRRGQLTFMQSTHATLSAFVCLPVLRSNNADSPHKHGILKNT